MLINPIILNSNIQQKKYHEYLFCPSENCLNVPEIYYSYNPLKPEIQYKCKCQNNEQKINMNLQEFVEKSNIFCHYCKKIINDDNFFICSDCNNIFDSNCKIDHFHNEKHINLSFINKHDIINNCKEHNQPFTFRCKNCNKSICFQCINFHYENRHSFNPMFEYCFNQNDFDKINSSFEKQKNILDRIKKINDDLFISLENDLKIKLKMIQNYKCNENNYNSIINLKKTNISNNSRYENIIQQILNNHEEKKDEGKVENKFLDEILLIFYYALMIIEDESIADALINDIEQKITNLKQLKMQIINNININKNNNEDRKSEKSINDEDNHNENNDYHNIDNNDNNNGFKNFFQNNNNIQNTIHSKKVLDNSFQNNSSNIIKSFSYQGNNLKKNESNIMDKNNSPNSNKIINNINNMKKEKNKENREGNKKQRKSLSFNRIKKKIKTSKYKKVINDDDSYEESEEEIIKNKKRRLKKNKTKSKENNNFSRNLVALKSGNFAISNKRKVEIYDFMKIDYSKKRCIFDNNFIKKNNCLLQKIYLDKNYKGKYINYIFQFSDETLLCSVYSQIIRVKLTNDDKDHEIIGYIKLNDSELTRKLISLGNNLLVILSEKQEGCYIKIYEKNDNYQIVSSNNNNQISYKIENDKQDIKNAKEDLSFIKFIDNCNEKKKVWSSIFEIKKGLKGKIEGNCDINYHKYLYEFIATSNAELDLGSDTIIFYGIIKDNTGRYHISTIAEIKEISCSEEPDSICQINNKYLCVGLQNYGKSKQISGFALINIFTRTIYKKIKDEQIDCLYFYKENYLLMASVEKTIKNKKFNFTKIYKINISKGNEENDTIELKDIFEHKNKQKDLITSINKINNEKLIFITISLNAEFEIIKAEIK